MNQKHGKKTDKTHENPLKIFKLNKINYFLNVKQKKFFHIKSSALRHSRERASPLVKHPRLRRE